MTVPDSARFNYTWIPDGMSRAIADSHRKRSKWKLHFDFSKRRVPRGGPVNDRREQRPRLKQSELFSQHHHHRLARSRTGERCSFCLLPCVFHPCLGSGARFTAVSLCNWVMVCFAPLSSCSVSFHQTEQGKITLFEESFHLE